jgi:hypothetical protein
VNIRSSDYFLIRFCRKSQSVLRRIADWESRLLAAELAAVRIEKPVFITGLARSGTTLLLELLATVEGAATHRYRDFPFLMIPYFWNRYLDWFPVQQEPTERAHRDRIYVTRENPEAMEEPLWHAFFPHVHSTTALHRLTAAAADPDFEQFYKAHLRKMLLIRGGARYFAKGNYHVPRIEYLAHLFPDAYFIVPIRHPLTHVHSLVRQHQLFSSYAAADARVPCYLEAAGHFEFGPQRVPIRLDAAEGDRILDAWSHGDEYLGYSIQWKEIYAFVETLRTTNPEIARRILVVRYEDLCEQPDAAIRHILQNIEVDLRSAGRVFSQLGNISKSQHTPVLDDGQHRAIRAEVGDVAEVYRYRLEAG